MSSCIVCGVKNYEPSLGGPTICPSCDCGNTVRLGNALYKRVVEANIGEVYADDDVQVFARETKKEQG